MTFVKKIFGFCCVAFFGTVTVLAQEVYLPDSQTQKLIERFEDALDTLHKTSPERLAGIQQFLVKKLYDMPMPLTEQDRKKIYLFKQITDYTYVLNSKNETERKNKQAELIVEAQYRDESYQRRVRTNRLLL